MAIAIPETIDDVDAAWLGGAIGRPVQAAEIQQIGVGVGVASALYRATLQGTDCPPTVVVKLPALDESAAFTSTVLRMYIREVAFFKTLAHELPFRVPACHYAEVDPESSRFAVVMEDLGALRAVDQTRGMSIEDARTAVDGLARQHALFWGRADALAEAGTTMRLDDPIYPAILPTVYEEGWQKLTGAMDMPASILDIGPRFAPSIEGLLKALGSGPNTLAHGDYRADNLLFDEAGELAVLDFQLIGTGTGAYDLAYFVTQSLLAEVAAEHERELFDRWLEGLEAGGAQDVDREELWLKYRQAALFCLVYPVVACRGMDLEDPRQFSLVESMNTRFDRAVRELSLAELL